MNYRKDGNNALNDFELAAGPGENQEQNRELNPLSIEAIKAKDYPGSEITIEQTLQQGSNYKRYIASYQSEGLKIHGLLTVPNAEPPPTGHPAIVFVHGYIPPNEYKTTEKYVAYVDSFARNNYVVFKIDLRGHGGSEGDALGSYYSNGYVTDALNAASSLQKYPGVNSEKIGMWGHSMGGNITLTSVVVSSKIKAAVIWAGVFATFDDNFMSWRNRRRQTNPSSLDPSRALGQSLIDQYGTPSQSSEFWREATPTNYLNSVTAPLQLHHGTADASVPVEFSELLKNKFDEAEKTAELHLYPGADHNISGSSFGTAMNRSVEFFDKFLK
jgi:dipeptidyl aminopeptidase/acylaminoacyl peptidase